LRPKRKLYYVSVHSLKWYHDFSELNVLKELISGSSITVITIKVVSKLESNLSVFYEPKIKVSEA